MCDPACSHCQGSMTAPTPTYCVPTSTANMIAWYITFSISQKKFTKQIPMAISSDPACSHCRGSTLPPTLTYCTPAHLYSGSARLVFFGYEFWKNTFVFEKMSSTNLYDGESEKKYFENFLVLFVSKLWVTYILLCICILILSVKDSLNLLRNITGVGRWYSQ